MKLKEILSIIDGKLICGEDKILENFCINTKDIHEGDIFVGLKGEVNDGSKYYLDALKNGASGVIINEGYTKEIIDGKFIVEVEDTVIALGKLAKYKRSKYNIPCVGITGSVGRTSTKDMISSVLESILSL